ncbi:MAG: hypothetical protein ACK559_34415, partial [bacterium]
MKDEREKRRLRREERITREAARRNPICQNVVIKKIPFVPANHDGAGTSSSSSADLDGVDETSPNLNGGLALMGQPASVNSAYSAVKAIRSTIRSNPSFM